MLTVEDLEVRYGRVRGTVSINFTVGEGEIVALVGSNGAGKSRPSRPSWAWGRSAASG